MTIVLSNLSLLSEGKQFETSVSLKPLELVQKVWGDFYKFLYLPSKSVIAKIVLDDIDLLFESQKSEMLIPLKQR